MTFNIRSTWSEYQAWVAYVNFNGVLNSGCVKWAENMGEWEQRMGVYWDYSEELIGWQNSGKIGLKMRAQRQSEVEILRKIKEKRVEKFRELFR